MKSVKTLVLAVLAILTTMAFMGATSAMAESTALCALDQSPCGEANQVTQLHETSVTKMKLLTTFLTVECDVLASGEVLLSLAWGLVHLKITWGNCGACTVEEESGPSEFKILRLGHETADVTGEFLMHAKCGSSLDCSYNGVGMVGTAKGPLLSTAANGEITFNKVTMNKEAGGFLCPSTSKLDLTTTPLTATYITS